MTAGAAHDDPSTPGDDLGVLVVGCGLIGRQRAQALTCLAGAHLAGTVDSRLDVLSGTSPAPHYEGLADVSPSSFSAAVIAVPHDHAAELASQVLALGKPVLVEKPLGTTTDQARSVEELARRVPAPSFVGFNYRFLPAVRGLLALVRDGRLGPLRNIDLLLGHGGHPGSSEGWKLDPVRAGGGVLLDPGVHLLDLLLAVAPGVRCTDVQATRGFWKTGIEEDVVATFRKDDILATVRTSHIRWVNTFRVEAFGEDGYAIAEGRGGNYGAMTLRVGERWGWRRDGVAGQRESETTEEFGIENTSLSDELAAVVRAWQGEVARTDVVGPATVGDGRVVTELCSELYGRLSECSKL